MDSKIEIIIDRSRYETSFTCPRLYHHQYVEGGHGLQPKGKAMYFAVGEAVHVGVQASMSGKSWPLTKQEMEESWHSHSLLVDSGEPLIAEQLDEQFDLAVALVYVWRLQRMPFWLQEYRVYDGLIEKEIVTNIYEDEQYVVKLMSRPDVVVERLSDGKLLLWELKTAGMINGQWIKRWTHALQLLLQVHAVERYIASQLDPREVVGIVVEGLIKGTRKRDSFGIKRQQSNLIYAYVKRGDGFIIKDQFSPVWKKGLSRELVSQHMQLEQWISSLDETIRQESIAVVPPLLADPETVQSVLTQVASRAIKLWEAEHTVGSLDELWPMNFSACHEFDDCHFLDACYMQSIKDDPIGSGKFVEREPNHEYERLKLGFSI